MIHFTVTSADTVLYCQTHVSANICTKTEVHGLVAGAGSGVYTDTPVDSFLSLKEDTTTFTDNVSFSPSVIYQDLVQCIKVQHVKNSVVNVEPLDGVLFSHQFGAEVGRVVPIFKNQTNYISLNGNEVIANATSDDSLTS